MTLEELQKNIVSLHVPSWLYSIDDGLKPNAYILYENYGMWEFFYLGERGDRTGHMFFPNSEKVYDICGRNFLGKYNVLLVFL